jgi:hypothetical protein
MAETFLRVPCMSGDDKCPTSLLLKRGHRTVLQRSARVWSTFPGSRGHFSGIGCVGRVTRGIRTSGSMDRPVGLAVSVPVRK